MLLTELNLVKFTGHMFENKAGTMILSKNRQEIKITKHTYLRHQFIR